MTRAWILLPLTLAAAPLAAQVPSVSRGDSRQLMRMLDEAVLNGDHNAYKGLASRDERRMTAERLRSQRLLGQPNGLRLAPGASGAVYVPTAAELRDHWFAIGQRAGEPRELHRAPVGQVDVRAEIPLALTLASPMGAPGRTLMIRTAVGAAQSQDGWSRMGEVTPDEHGTYRVEIPALHAGTYDLQIEVYDPDVPEIPFSSSRSTLIAWVP